MGAFYYNQCPVPGDVGGDVGGDELLDISDIVQIVDCILTYSGDCIVDVLDIVILVEMIIGN